MKNNILVLWYQKLLDNSLITFVQSNNYTMCKLLLKLGANSSTRFGRAYLPNTDGSIGLSVKEYADVKGFDNLVKLMEDEE